MPTTLYSAFLPEVLPRAPGVPQIIAVNAIRNAAIEFCSRSCAWNERQAALSVTGDMYLMPITAPDEARAAVLLAVKVGARTVPPKTPQELDAAGADWDEQVGDVYAYYQPSPDSLRLVAIPASPVEVRLHVAYCPTRDSTGLATFLYDNYLEALAAGAVFRLNGDTNAQAQFEVGVRNAAVAAKRAFTTTSTLQVDLSGAR